MEGFMTEFIWQSEFLTLLFDVVFFSFCIWFLFWVSEMVMKLIAKADGKDGTDRKGEESEDIGVCRDYGRVCFAAQTFGGGVPRGIFYHCYQCLCEKIRRMA